MKKKRTYKHETGSKRASTAWDDNQTRVLLQTIAEYRELYDKGEFKALMTYLKLNVEAQLGIKFRKTQKQLTDKVRLLHQKWKQVLQSAVTESGLGVNQSVVGCWPLWSDALAAFTQPGQSLQDLIASLETECPATSKNMQQTIGEDQETSMATSPGSVKRAAADYLTKLKSKRSKSGAEAAAQEEIKAAA